MYPIIHTLKENLVLQVAGTKSVKGKGVSFMENQAGWHGKAPNDEQLAQALEELKWGVGDGK